MSPSNDAGEIPAELLYTREHEWLRREGDEGTIGITHHAQDQLGDIVFLDLPAVGAQVRAGERFGEIESVKTVSDLYAPISGEVIAANDRLADEPELVNEGPYGDGWLVRVRIADESELEELLSAEAYAAQIPDL